jgi:hypothetical protein
MYRFKKILIVIITIIYLLLSLIELSKYLFIGSNIYGVLYLIFTLFIIFLLIPVAYNYKRHYSKERLSKILIIDLVGLFTSFVLFKITNSIFPYVDSSALMVNNIFVIKNILKPILYFILFLLFVIDSKTFKKLLNIKNGVNSLGKCPKNI